MKVYLKKGHVKPVWLGHPWVFAQSVDKTDSQVGKDFVATVYDPRGNYVGWGFVSPNSSIRVRIASRYDPPTSLEEYFYGSIKKAFNFRKNNLNLPSVHTNVYRLVNSEGDGLPGLIVDIYDKVAVIQIDTLPIFTHRDVLARVVRDVVGVDTVFFLDKRPPNEGERVYEGFELAYGEKVDELIFKEHDLSYTVPLDVAQKSGFYIDQRENRLFIRNFVNSRKVLDLCCYVGGFMLNALYSNASLVVGLDRNPRVLQSAYSNVKLNGFYDNFALVEGSFKSDLNRLLTKYTPFDVVIFDPPGIGKKRYSLNAAVSLYQTSVSRILELLAEDAVLVVCSCSYLIGKDELFEAVAAAASKFSKIVSLYYLGSQASCHLTPLVFNEGRYLSCVFCRISRW